MFHDVHDSLLKEATVKANQAKEVKEVKEVKASGESKSSESGLFAKSDLAKESKSLQEVSKIESLERKEVLEILKKVANCIFTYSEPEKGFVASLDGSDSALTKKMNELIENKILTAKEVQGALAAKPHYLIEKIDIDALKKLNIQPMP